MELLTMIALGSLAIQGASAGLNWYYGNKANERADKQADNNDELLELQRQSLGIQQDSLNESLRSNYYSYMQNLASMQGDYAQNVNAINQQQENIASNMNYLERWADEYDQSMQSNIDESFNQYQQLASNYASGLVGNAETGKRGGTAGRMASDAGMTLASYNGGMTNGLNLNGSRFGSYLQSTSMDMLADRQTALSAVGTSYKAIGSYQSAMDTLSGTMKSMESTTDSIKEKLKGTTAEIKEVS